MFDIFNSFAIYQALIFNAVSGQQWLQGHGLRLSSLLGILLRLL